MELYARPVQPIWEKYSRKDDLYELRSRYIDILIKSQNIPGIIKIRIEAGYFTDFRSGSNLLNPIIPKIGNLLIMYAWLVHDINYHGFLSRKYADLLLREMLEYAGMGKIKRNAVYYAVRAFGGSHYNFLYEDQGEIYNKNKQRVQFEWIDRRYLKAYKNAKFHVTELTHDDFYNYPVLINKQGG